MAAPGLTTGELWELLASRGKDVLATIERDGRLQLSNISYIWEPETRSLTIQVAPCPGQSDPSQGLPAGISRV